METNTRSSVDDKAVLDFFEMHRQDPPRELTLSAASQVSFWGEDLSAIPSFTETTGDYFDIICKEGMRKAMEKLLNSVQKEETV